MDIAIPPREETGSQISARLLEVIAHAELEVLPGLYAFGPLTDGVTPPKDALACVRDGGGWSHADGLSDLQLPLRSRVRRHRVRRLAARASRTVDGHRAHRRLWPLGPRRHRSRARRHLRLLGMPGAGGRCLLCEAATGTPRLPLVAESAGAVAVLSVGEPSAAGHCVFFPRRHTP